MTSKWLSRWRIALGVFVVATGFATYAQAFGPGGELATVDLRFRPPIQSVEVGDIVEIGLYAISTGDFDHVIASLTAILDWDPQYLRLLDNVDNGPYDWLVSAFPTTAGIDIDGKNVTWTDGDAFYAGLGHLNPEPLPIATTDGLLVTTFQFRALAATPGTTVNIPPDMGGLAATEVFDGITPGTPVTGELGSAIVQIVPEPATLALLLVGAAALRFRRR